MTGNVNMKRSPGWLVPLVLILATFIIVPVLVWLMFGIIPTIYQDSMARKSLPGLEMTREDAPEIQFTFKPRPSILERCFAPQDRASENPFDSLRDYAIQDGWEEIPDTTQEGTWSASKSFWNGRELSLGIIDYADRPPSSASICQDGEIGIVIGPH